MYNEGASNMCVANHPIQEDHKIGGYWENHQWFYVLKYLTTQDVVSNKIYPCGIILGQGKLNYDIWKLTPGDYHQVYVGITNTPKYRRVDILVLRPWNDRKGYYLMSWETGKRIHVYHWDNYLPIVDILIDIVEDLSSGKKMPLLHNGSSILDGREVFP